MDAVSLLCRDLRVIRSLVDLSIDLVSRIDDPPLADAIAAAIALDVHVRVVLENEILYPILRTIDVETGGRGGMEFLVGHRALRDSLLELCSSSSSDGAILAALADLAAVADAHFSRQERDSLPGLRRWLDAELLAALGEMVEHRRESLHGELRAMLY